MRLGPAILSTLAGSNVAVPSFDRSQIVPGILHVGVGNFHRAHMAAYIDDLMEEDFATNKQWGIVGAGMFDCSKRDYLAEQDWMQILVERDAGVSNAQVLSSMIDYLPVDVKAIEAQMEDPNIKIVSLTVTEGGYFLADGKFNAKDPNIKADIADPENPKTIFGAIVKALKKRRDAGMTPFTVMSCDNLPHNGDVVKSVVMGLAKEIDADLADWIEANAKFPNGMVDRITPATTEEQQKYVLDTYGVEDHIPIFCEPFRQWVLEDNFVNGERPQFDVLESVKFVPDVSPYEFMKIRILNGGHASLCYPSALLGVDYVHEAMEHPTIGPFLDCLERNEIIPTVGPVPDTDLEEYWQVIEKRFSNPTLGDTIPRNCFDGASRQPKFIVPVVKDNLEAGRCVDGLALVSAMWCKYCQGKTESGETIKPNDPIWDELHETALKANKDPALWVGMSDVYGETGKNPTFVSSFAKALEKVNAEGVEAAMKAYIESKVESESELEAA